MLFRSLISCLRSIINNRWIAPRLCDNYLPCISWSNSMFFFQFRSACAAFALSLLIIILKLFSRKFTSRVLDIVWNEHNKLQKVTFYTNLKISSILYCFFCPFFVLPSYSFPIPFAFHCILPVQALSWPAYFFPLQFLKFIFSAIISFIKLITFMDKKK